MAAKYFQNRQERDLVILSCLGYIHGLSVSRFNRRLHALQAWLSGMVQVVAEVFTTGEVVIIDSMPLPQSHEYRRDGTAKMLALFHPANGQVFVKGVRRTTNAIVHNWLFELLLMILDSLSPAIPDPLTSNDCCGKPGGKGFNTL